MKCRLKKIPHLSGNKASVYSVIIDQCQDTLFEVFLKENAELHMNELTNILLRIKTKQTRALQDSPKLTKENYLMREISRAITKNIIDKNICYSDDGLEFEGELEFTIKK